MLRRSHASDCREFIECASVASQDRLVPRRLTGSRLMLDVGPSGRTQGNIAH